MISRFILRKLGNKGLVSKATAEVINAEKTKLAELERQLTAMTAQMEELSVVVANPDFRFYLTFPLRR